MGRNDINQIFFLFLIMAISSCVPQKLKNQVCFKQHCCDVEIVSNEADRERGLQFRKSMGANEGMLFVFPHEEQYAFWMKDTYIPLDIIWLDYAKRVVHVEENVPPCRIAPCPTYRPADNALYVLEVNAGYAKKIGLKAGDVAEFRLKSL